MQHTLKLAARSAAIALAVGLGAGCATSGELEEVRAIATKAQQEAQAARDAAAQGADAAAAAAAAQADGRCGSGLLQRNQRQARTRLAQRDAEVVSAITVIGDPVTPRYL